MRCNIMNQVRNYGNLYPANMSEFINFKNNKSK